MVNDNLVNETQITSDAMINNPKLVSFKLMKLDIDQSCRSKCEIEKKQTTPGKPISEKHFQVIANSSDQLHVQAMQQQKVLMPKPEQEPRGYSLENDQQLVQLTKMQNTDQEVEEVPNESMDRLQLNEEVGNM